MSTPGNPRITFRAQPELMDQAEARAGTGIVGSASEAARRDLERYYLLIERELALLDLSGAEWNLLRDASNGVIWEAWSAATMLWANTEDAIRLYGLDEKWEVDGEALVRKLRNLSAGAVWAVIDAVERWWAEQSPGVAG